MGTEPTPSEATLEGVYDDGSRYEESTDLNARIGVAETSKVIELDVEDPVALRQSIEAALSDGSDILWLRDTKKRDVGVPVARIAFVEIESEESSRSVGFAP